jgi:SAM-dependent methyltransferase
MNAHGKHAPFAHPEKNIEAFGILPGATVADFGAGSGHYTLAIATFLEGSGIVYAIDVQADLLRRLKNEAHARGLTNVQTIWGDIARLEGTKLAPMSVDFVVMSNVLFQLEDPKMAFDEARRILKLGGHLVIIDWIDSGGVGASRLGPRKQHVFGKDRALDTARSSGFEAGEHFAAGAHHYGLILRKSSR